MDSQHQVAEAVGWTTKIFSATVNGVHRQVMIEIPADKAGDVEEAYAIMMSTEDYWAIFWGFSSRVNPEAGLGDFTVQPQDMKLTKVVTG